MLSDIFEMFYARVRALQYLHFILHFALFKRNSLPVLTYKNNEIHVESDVYKYYPEEESEAVIGAISHSILYNRKTHLYEIDHTGKYIHKLPGNENDDRFKIAVNMVKNKHYQKIHFIKDS